MRIPLPLNRKIQFVKTGLRQERGPVFCMPAGVYIGRRLWYNSRRSGRLGRIRGGRRVDTRIKDCLEHKEGSYILPFFWQHGEDHEALLEEIEAIKASGAREFCVESRVYEHFCEDAWWEDFGFILDAARQRDMKVWLLDDKRFPTGFANDILGKKYPHLRKRCIRETHRDFLGPLPGGTIPSYDRYRTEGERLMGVYAYRRSGEGEALCGDPIDLTGRLEDGLIRWDIPEGVWRVFWLVDTDDTPDCYRHYIDMLHPDSCRMMLEAVYEPHYRHFGADFGKTFQGFFSDEPCFGNNAGDYNARIGRPGLAYPWRDSLYPLICQETGWKEEKVRGMLPALWYDCGRETAAFRVAYMNAITKEYSRNFGWMLGDWCRAHGVKYIGHVIEDMNAHMRTGYGAGHFFRALDGQDMAGMDIVLNQLVPGLNDMVHTASISGGLADPAFFHYTLAKLAASHSHLQPLKQGRAMCEIFGAFGWAEGLPAMARMADHMLVNGINHFVPHAFSPKYPDGDCPPHFYAKGQNPQFPLFGRLMTYMQRVSHVLTGGTHIASAAVLYGAEAEWAGGDYALFQTVCKALTDGLLDFDIVHEDILFDGAEMRDGKLVINGVAFDALAVSYSQKLPYALLEKLADFAAAGLDVVFADGLCQESVEGKDISSLQTRFRVCPLENLAADLRARGHFDIESESPCPDLRFYHIRREGQDIYMFHNQSLHRPVDTCLHLRQGGEGVLYDAFDNRVFALNAPEGRLPLYLPGGGSCIVAIGGRDADMPAGLPPALARPDESRTHPACKGPYTIELRPAGEEAFRFYKETDRLADITADPALSRFCGAIRYTACLTAPETAEALLDLGQVGETAEVWVNGKYCGARLQAPYRFRAAEALQPGENRLTVEVINSPAYRERDYFSGYLPFPPSGLIGPIQWI